MKLKDYKMLKKLLTAISLGAVGLGVLAGIILFIASFPGTFFLMVFLAIATAFAWNALDTWFPDLFK